MADYLIFIRDMWFRKKDPPIIGQIKNQDADFSKLFHNIANREESEGLYKYLQRATHPDLYVGNPNKQKLAEELFKIAQANQTDLEILKELKLRVINELNNEVL